MIPSTIDGYPVIGIGAPPKTGGLRFKKTVTATKKGLTMSLQIGKPQITVNGKTIDLDVAPQIVNGRTLVPVRAVSEAVNAKADWDDKTSTVIITA